MEILDPLIEGRRQRAVLRKGRPDAALRHRADAGKPKAGDQAAREKLAPVDFPLQQLFARAPAEDVFLFFSHCHRLLPGLD